MCVFKRIKSEKFNFRFSFSFVTLHEDIIELHQPIAEGSNSGGRKEENTGRKDGRKRREDKKEGKEGRKEGKEEEGNWAGLDLSAGRFWPTGRMFDTPDLHAEFIYTKQKKYLCLFLFQL